MRDVPSLMLGITMAVYWCCVGAMVVRVSRRGNRADRVLIPKQRRERFMWLVWVPLVVAWVAMPLIARTQDPARWPLIALPAIAQTESILLTARTGAAGLAIILLLLSIRCWRHMGSHWRMGVDPANSEKLIVDGPFSRVRHPIYSLSVALMICSGLIVPTPAMLGIVVTHIALMVVKARNEEAFLSEIYGDSYSEYCKRTGRFIPRLRAYA